MGICKPIPRKRICLEVENSNLLSFSMKRLAQCDKAVKDWAIALKLNARGRKENSGEERQIEKWPRNFAVG